MKRDQILQYCDLLERVKVRISFVEDVLEKHQDWAEPIRDDVIHLQFRKILESIAFSSLVSNRDAFSRAYRNFSKYWNAADLLKDLSKINPAFYPQPFVHAPATAPGVNHHFEKRTGDILTKHDFISLYGQCGDVLHERNPYAKPLVRRFARSHYQRWLDRIFNLLETHVIRLVDDPNIYFVHLVEADGRVHHYTGVPKTAGVVARGARWAGKI